MTYPVALNRSERIAGRPVSHPTTCVSQSTVQAIAVFCEAASVVLASRIAQFLLEQASATPVDAGAALSLGLVAAGLHMVLGQLLGLHRFSALLAPSLVRAALGVCAAVFSLRADLAVVKGGTEVPDGFLAVFAAVLLATTVALRPMQARLLQLGIRNQRIQGRPAILIGLDGELDHLSARDLFEQFGLSEVARIPVHDGSTDQADIDRATTEALLMARVLGAETLVVASAWSNAQGLARLERGLRRSPLPVWLVPDASARSLMTRHRAVRGGDLVVLQPAPLGVAARSAKRAVDLVLASGALLALLPVLAVIAVAVKLESRGPVLFRQRRIGFDQRVFTINKFRTMTVQEDNAVHQARRADTRVTRVGRVLRRTSLDELPQLINVLRGEMALVGPRPHALAHDRQFDAEIDNYCVRHRVKPGITGWAQVNGLRGETADVGRLVKRVEHDLWYVNHWSLALDVRILLRTCAEVLAHDAY